MARVFILQSQQSAWANRSLVQSEPTVGSRPTLVLNNSSGGSVSITGLEIVGQQEGNTFTILNLGSDPIVVISNSSEVVTANRFADPASIPADSSIGVYYNGLRWEVLTSTTGTGGYTAEEAQDAVGSILTNSPEIAFTYNDATPSITAALIAASIAASKLDAGVNASLALANSALQSIANDSITYAKMQNVSATDRLLGRDTAGAGDVEEISLAGSLVFTGAQAIQLSGDSASPGNNTYYGTNGAGTKGFYGLTVQTTQSGTTYSLVAADLGTEVRFSNAAAKTITIPSTGTLGTGFIAILTNIGAGDLAIVAGGGVTLRNDVADIPQYGSATIRAIGTDEYIVTPTIVNHANIRSFLGLVIGTNVQAFDADLSTIAGLTPTTDNFLQAKSSAWASRTVAQVTADLQGSGLLADAVGFRNIPQNPQSANYTLVASDSGKHILHPSTDANTRTFTIPANGTLAFPIGTAVTFVNETSQNVTIAITTDTLTLAGSTTTGSRTLAQNGVATALKVTSTKWIISGTGLT